jgi:hypothetical protein
MAEDLDPHDLDEVRRRVVDPVVASLLRPGELDDVALQIGREYVHSVGDAEVLIVRIWARGELPPARGADPAGPPDPAVARPGCRGPPDHAVHALRPPGILPPTLGRIGSPP